jgi:hypothetical protein
VKGTGRDEPLGILIHIYMETTQGNSLCTYRQFKLAKTSCFSFYLLCFFIYKIGEREGEPGFAGVGRWESFHQ